MPYTDPEQRLAYQRTYYALHRERYATLALRYAKTETGRNHRNAAKARYWRKNAHKRLAHDAVKIAVRAGRLERRPCEVCGGFDVEAHHEDYRRPLQVRWLCRPHHREWHKANNAKNEG